MNTLIKVAHLNCHSFSNKFHKIYELVNKKGIDVLSLNETLFNNNSNHHSILKGFELITSNRKHKRGGGVGLLIRNNLKIKLIESESNENFEFIAVEFQNLEEKTLIVSAYTPPSSKTNFEFLNTFSSKFKNIIILADFNAIHTSWGCNFDNSKGRKLREILDENNLILLNDNRPTFTRSKNVLDLAIISSNLFPKASNFEVLTDFKISDHWPIFFQLENNVNQKEINKIDFNQLNLNLDNITFSEQGEIFDIQNIDKRLLEFNDKIKTAIDNSKKTIEISKMNLRIPKYLASDIKLKKKLMRIYTKTHDPTVKNQINNLNNSIHTKIKKINTEKWNTVFENLIELKPNEKKFWKCLKTDTNEKTLLEGTNLNESEKLETLANHFESTLNVINNPYDLQSFLNSIKRKNSIMK